MFSMEKVQEIIYGQIVSTINELLEAQEAEKQKKQERGERIDQPIGVEAMLFNDGHLEVFPSMRIESSGSHFHPGSMKLAIDKIDSALQADESFRRKFRTLSIGNKALRIKEVAAQ